MSGSCSAVAGETAAGETSPIGSVALLMVDTLGGLRQGSQGSVLPRTRSSCRRRTPDSPPSSVLRVLSELERPPLRVEALRRELVAPSGPYAAVDVVDSVPSTNTALAAAARDGAADR